MITGKLYDRLKWLAQVALPALATLYFTLGGIWDLPSISEVVRTIVAVDFFIGVLLGISQINYKKQVATGAVNIKETPSGQMFDLVLDGDPHSLSEKHEARFRVVKQGS